MPLYVSPTSEIKKVGIVGEGKMGTSIFNYLLNFNFDLVWICSPGAEIEAITRQTGKKIKRLLNAGIIDDKRFYELQQIPVTSNLKSLSECDLIIETIPEILELKKDLFLQLDRIAKAEAIFTSNSSSINPSDIAPRGTRKREFAGLHFFYPVQLKNIVELMPLSETSNSACLLIETFLEVIQRRFITLEEKNSFILNKIFLDFQNEAFRIVHSGHCSIPQMDQLVKKYFFPFGIFDFCDNVGIDTMLASIQNYTKGYPHHDYYDSFIAALNELASAGKFGVKSQVGFYKYPQQEITIEEPICSVDITEHLKQTYHSASKRFAAQAHIPIDDLNYAIKEYFGIEKGPFE